MTETKGKTVAIISYLTLIGLVIALIMHYKNKTDFGAFHIRQSLGIIILGFILSSITNFINVSILSRVADISILILSVIGFVSAIQGERKLVPFVGEKIQEVLLNINYILKL